MTIMCNTFYNDHDPKEDSPNIDEREYSPEPGEIYEPDPEPTPDVYY